MERTMVSEVVKKEESCELIGERIAPPTTFIRIDLPDEAYFCTIHELLPSCHLSLTYSTLLLLHLLSLQAIRLLPIALIDRSLHLPLIQPERGRLLHIQAAR